MRTNDALRKLAGLAVLLDAAAVMVAGWFSWLGRFERPTMAEPYLVALVLGVLLALVLLPALGAYRDRNWVAPVTGVRRALPGLLTAMIILILLAAATQTTADFSRLWTGFWLLLSLMLMASWRVVVQHWLAVRGARRQPRLLILGTGRLARETARRLLSEYGEEDLIAGFLTIGDDYPEDLPAPVLGEIDQLKTILAEIRPRITEIWLASGNIDLSMRKRVIEELHLASLPVRYVPDLTMLNLIAHTPSQIAGMTVIELNATPLDGPNAMVKTVLDRVLSALLLLVLSPLLLTIAVLIRLDSPGPVLFRQPRHGGDGEVFDVLKFRTMCNNDKTFDGQATRDDPRVTRIGRFLRRSSIDELPQLINVLRGEMSLVGPRPHPVALNRAYADRIHSFMQRHRVRPGMTGWAQINGYRGETDTLEKMQKRFEHDLYYIENWSLALDARILLLTLLKGWRDQHAY